MYVVVYAAMLVLRLRGWCGENLGMSGGVLEVAIPFSSFEVTLQGGEALCLLQSYFLQNPNDVAEQSRQPTVASRQTRQETVGAAGKKHFRRGKGV